jgi:hypothetical protein
MRHAYLPAKDLGMDIIVGCIGVVLIVYLFFRSFGRKGFSHANDR